jgi:hypothetical protein
MIFERDWPYVSWKCTASFSTGMADITSSSIGTTVPGKIERDLIQKDICKVTTACVK